MNQRRVKQLTDWDEWRNLWENSANRLDWWEMAYSVNPQMTKGQFDKGWQWCQLLHENEATARQEWVMLMAWTF